jgi:predicted ATPase
MDIGMTCRIFAGWVLWFLGYPDQALKRSYEAITLAQELSHPYSLSFALYFTAELHQFRREWRLAQERAEAAMALAAEQRFPLGLSQAVSVRGWALVEQGQGEEGIAQIRQSFAAWRATGAELRRTYFLTLLAEAYGTVGQVAEGLRIVTEALAVVDEAGERLWEAELYRLKGQLTLRSSISHLSSQVEEEAEACFLKAIEIARRQQAKSLELRGVMSLSRLWQQQGKKDEARPLLADIYHWFTEGFDTKDLQEAKALLNELTEGQ